ncbi:MAG: hypothetical protein DU481_09750 [Nitrosomonas sp.]
MLIGQNFKPMVDDVALIRPPHCFLIRQSYWQSILPGKKCADDNSKLLHEFTVLAAISVFPDFHSIL